MNNSTPIKDAAAAAPDWLSARLIAGLVLLLCLAITLALWQGARRDARDEAQADFDFRARELMNNLAARMANYVQLLRGTQGLFDSSGVVTRAEFASYVDALDLQSQYSGFQSIGYMQLVAHGERAAHVAAVRREGYPDYTILPYTERDFYTPVLFIEPFSAGNLPAFGFDPSTEPVRRAALERARDSAQPAMSGKLTLVQEKQGQAGFVVMLPVYRANAALDTLGRRRDQIKGWVFAAFRMGDLMAGLGGERAAGLDVEVYDGDRVLDAARMYDTSGGALHPPLALRTVQPISIAGHRWTVAIGAPPALAQRLQDDKPGTLLAGGLAATLVLTVLAWLLAQSRASARIALAHARRLAADLEAGQKRLGSLADSAQRSGAMLRSILDSTIDGILVDNGDRRVIASNQRFRELWSVPEALDVAGEDERLLEHILDQLMHPAPFLYSRSLQYQDEDEHRDLLRLKDGRYFEQFTRAIRLGSEQARLWSFRDITERKQIEQRERWHRHVLELLGRSAPLPAILDAVVLGVETSNPGMLCSILLLDAEGRRLYNGAAPSLPAFFNDAIDGAEIGQGIGSCGTAAVSGARVIVEDIMTHPYWRDYRELAMAAGLGACWSEPIRGVGGKILGTFAIYHAGKNYPSPAHVVLIEQAAQLAGIAIEQAQAALALRAGEERFRSLYDNAPVALWEHDWSKVRAALAGLQHEDAGEIFAYLNDNPDQVRRLAALVRVVDLNGAALAQIGAAGKDAGVIGLSQNFDESALPAFAAAVSALAGGSHRFSCESSFRCLDGSVRQNQLTLLVMPGHAVELDFVIVSTVDITERKRIDAELLMLATTDFLTGLPNRREFMGRMEDELARMQRSVDGRAAVLMLDIDHFKTVNDEFGHATGDAVLRHLAALMVAGQRKIDTLGRVGGEEFAVLLPGADLDAAAAYAERLRQKVADTPLAHGADSIRVTISIGIATIRADDPSADAALIRADKALYRAKEAGRNQVAHAPEVRMSLQHQA